MSDIALHTVALSPSSDAASRSGHVVLQRAACLIPPHNGSLLLGAALYYTSLTPF